jgi:hypothetical protein
MPLQDEIDGFADLRGRSSTIERFWSTKRM